MYKSIMYLHCERQSVTVISEISEAKRSGVICTATVFECSFKGDHMCSVIRLRKAEHHHISKGTLEKYAFIQVETSTSALYLSCVLSICFS